ncbi:PKD domain-containing protein [Bacteroides thetaiotaomicron]|nr:PKD domain-containing protein [Bacteroides thetaiotaomicron]MCS2282397.1 PKD domain-containing protein [Bacteroides thetaiotaomicron]
METGETVHYADSTCNARSWLWEFGNGDISHERSGEYVFKKPGRYQVRLQWREDWKGNRSSQYTGAGMITEATNLSGRSTGNRLSRRNRIFQRIRSVERMALAVRRIRNCRFAGAEPTLRLYRTRHIRGSADYGEYPPSGPVHH